MVELNKPRRMNLYGNTTRSSFNFIVEISIPPEDRSPSDPPVDPRANVHSFWQGILPKHLFNKNEEGEDKQDENESNRSLK